MRFLLFLLLCPAVLWAVPPTITVEANAITQIVPDKIEIAIRIQNTQQRLKDSRAAVDRSLERLHQAMTAAGLDPKRLVLDDIQQNREYNWESQRQVLIGYAVILSARITVTDLKHVRGLTNELLDDEDIAIVGLTLITDHEGEVRLQTLANAATAAQKKAEILAQTLGVAVGKPVEIVETSYAQPPSPRPMLAQMRANAQASIQPEENVTQMSVQGSVKVVFELVPKHEDVR